jgi:hypothetical protein
VQLDRPRREPVAVVRCDQVARGVGHRKAVRDDRGISREPSVGRRSSLLINEAQFHRAAFADQR